MNIGDRVEWNKRDKIKECADKPRNERDAEEVFRIKTR